MICRTDFRARRMSSGPTDDKLYSEQEVASILRRSARLQRESEATETSGLTLAELKHIAAEVGIDPAHVEAASRDIRSGAREDGEAARSLFLPLTSEDSYVVRGEIGDGQWEDVADDIRSLYGGFGTVGQVGSQLNWTHTRFPEPSIQVSVASRSGRTKVRAQSDYSNLMAFFMPAMFASSAIVAAVTIETLGLPTAAVIVAIGLWLTIYWMVVRAIVSGLNKKERRRAGAHGTDRADAAADGSFNTRSR
ncbi:MAG: hypothetical protein R3178_07720, partial [Rhodothermales bacterium]|nr:hypothetical protein [Rhodothermales bacterium]